MKVCNEMKLSFPSRSANEAFARTAVSAFAAALDPTIEELADLKTAVQTINKVYGCMKEK